MDPKGRILDLLSSATTVAVAAHRNPDGDAVGSVLAVAEILSAAGKEALVIPQKNVSAKYGFLSGWSAFLAPWTPPGPIDVLVCVDAGGADRLPKPAQKILAAGTPAINIDHHLSNPGFGTVNWVDPNAPSTSFLIYLVFKESRYKINLAAAEALYVGLVTDTGRFSYSNANAEAFTVAAELVKLGVIPFQIERDMNGDIQISYFHIFGAALGTMKRAGRGDIVYMYTSRGMLDSAGADDSDTEGIADYTRRVSGMRLGVFFREMEDGNVQVSFRSGGDVNVRLLTESFGGGGHNEAAGCKMNGPLNEAIESVVVFCEKWLEEND